MSKPREGQHVPEGPFFIQPQGVVHVLTPEMGSGEQRRPMLIAKTDNGSAGLAGQPWPAPSPGIAAGTVDPAAPLDWPMSPLVLIPGPIYKRFSSGSG